MCAGSTSTKYPNTCLATSKIGGWKTNVAQDRVPTPVCQNLVVLPTKLARDSFLSPILMRHKPDAVHCCVSAFLLLQLITLWGKVFLTAHTFPMWSLSR